MDFLQSFDVTRILEIFFATFVGVWSAFKLERLNKNRDLRQKNFERFVEAQGYLQMQKNIIGTIHREIMPLKKDPQRTGMLPPIIINTPDKYIGLSDLSFLLGSKNLLALNIIALQSNVKSALSGLSERNEQHKLIQKTTHASFEGGSPKKLYDVNYKILNDMTDDLYRDIENLMEKIESLYLEFESYGLELFPKAKPEKVKSST